MSLNLPKVYLAPMEGVVDPVIRDVFSRIGGYDQMVTEFVRVTRTLLPDHVFYKYSPELKNKGLTFNGTPVYVQLLGGDPNLLAENAAKAISLGAPGIDLNFGCPAKTVNRHDGGATLLKNPSRLYDVLSAVKRAVPSHPVTAKVRLGFEHKDFVEDIANCVSEAKAHRLTVHARTKLEGYRPPAHWEYIAKMKAVSKVPVVANGDIWTVEDYKKCVEVSGCKDVALGRPAMASPSLAKQIKALYQEESVEALSWEDLQHNWFPQFAMMSAQQKNSHYALVRSKQWSKLLAREYHESEDFFQRIKTYKKYDDFWETLKSDPKVSGKWSHDLSSQAFAN